MWHHSNNEVGYSQWGRDSKQSHKGEGDCGSNLYLEFGIGVTGYHVGWHDCGVELLGFVAEKAMQDGRTTSKEIMP